MDTPSRGGSGGGGGADGNSTLHQQAPPAATTLAASGASARLMADLNLGRDAYTAVEVAGGYDWKTEDGKLRVHRAETKALASSFYLSPYLTCMECNTLHMVNSTQLFMQIVASIQQGSGIAGVAPEALPVCTGCQRSYAFSIGAEDFSAQIVASKATLDKLREASALRVQIAYRGLAGRMDAVRALRRKRQRKRTMRLAATRVENKYRIHVAHKVLRVKRAVKRVCAAHPIVITGSLLPRVGQLKTYWFDREEELELLQRDYRELVRRSGNSPPKHVVERNLLEMERRVHEIECMYAARIQKRFRGMVGRRFMIFYRQAVARRLGYHNTAALRIQLFFRNAFARKARARLRFEQQTARWQQEYLDGNAAERRAAARRDFTARVQQWYTTERDQEVVARYTGKTAYGAYGGKRQIAFQNSPFADTEPVQLNIKVVRDEEARLRSVADAEQKALERKLFLLGKFDADPRFRLLWGDEMGPLDEESFRMKLELDERKRVIVANNRKGIGNGNAPAAIALAEAEAAEAEDAARRRLDAGGRKLASRASGGGSGGGDGAAGSGGSGAVVKLPPVHNRR